MLTHDCDRDGNLQSLSDKSEDRHLLVNGNGIERSPEEIEEDGGEWKDDSLSGGEVDPLEMLTTVIADEGESFTQQQTTGGEYFLLGFPQPTHFLEDGGGSPPPNSTGNATGDQRGSLGEPSDESRGCDNEDDDDEGCSPPPPISAGVFQCTECPSAFKYQYLLGAHRRQVHSTNSVQAAPHCCLFCGENFSDRHSLKVHTAAHVKPNSAGTSPVANMLHMSPQG